MDVFSQIHNQRPKTPSNAHDAVRATLLSSEERLLTLEKKINRLALVTHGLWALPKDRHGYSEAELQDWVNLIDIEDGHLDGRVRPQVRPPRECAKCKRVVSQDFSRCMYCDEPISTNTPFDRVH